jgi:multiple sugar transport system substrate-binding protein
MGKETRNGSRVSRRAFVRAAGVSGVTAGTIGLAGCLGSAGEGVVIHGDADFQAIRDPVMEALREVGLDGSVSYEVWAVGGDSEDRRQSVQSALQAGRSPPDIFMMDSGWTIPFILREQTVNLSDRLSSETLDRVENEYLDAAVETARHPETGELHALPLFPDFSVMLYRRDLVEEAGYDTNGWATEALSWQEFSGVVADVRRRNDLDFGFTTQAPATELLACCTFNETMSSWGGAYFGGVEDLFETGDRPVTVEEEPVVNAIRMMRAFMYGEQDEHALEGYERIAPTSIVQWQEQDSLAPFENGNAVAHRNWPFTIAESHETFGDALGMMLVPYGVTEEESEYEGLGGSRAALGGWHLAINPHSDRREEAVAVLEAFADPEVQMSIFEEQGWLPPETRLLETSRAEEVEPFGRYADTLRVLGEGAVPRPATDLWAEQAGVIAIELHNAYARQKTPEDAMADLRTRLIRSERQATEADDD